MRLGAKDLVGDKWFCFASTDYGEVRGELQSPQVIVEQINRLVLGVAEPWWKKLAEGIADPR